MSGGSEEGRGILETSPGAITVLILFFLLVTLGFEWGLHWIKHTLKRRKKLGLHAAVSKLSNELMLLAVASIFLTALEPAVTKVCLPADQTMQPWLLHVNGCACCLAKTEGVTPCFLESRQCPADLDQQCGADGPYRPIKKGHIRYAKPTNGTEPVNSTEAAAEGTHTAAGHAGKRRRLAAATAAAGHAAALQSTAAGNVNGTAAAEEVVAEEEPVCVGHYEEAYEECNYVPGLVPAVTATTLEQVHMLLFIMAVVHIVISGLVILLSTTKLWLWYRLGGKAAEDSLAAAAVAAAFGTPMAAPAGLAASAGAPAAKSAAPGLDTAAAAVGSAAPDKAAGDQGPEPAASGAAAAAGAPARSTTQQAAQQATVLVVDAVSTVPVATGLKVAGWRGRPEAITSAVSFFKECVELLLRQLLLLVHPTLTRQEYSVLRASFYLTHLQSHHAPPAGKAAAAHDAPHTHCSTAPPVHSSTAAKAAVNGDASINGKAAAALPAGLYRPYLLENIERDGSKAVGLGLPMWILVICFVLLSGAIGWATWLFLILAGIMLLCINTLLLTTARHMTRGGIVRPMEPGASRWRVLHNARLLLGVIKLLLFFLSFVISNSVYFAAFFGPQSCFFSRTGFQMNPIPWWGIMLIDLYLLLSLALFTLPLYTLITHTLKADRKLLQQIQQEQQAQANPGFAAESGHAHESGEWE